MVILSSLYDSIVSLQLPGGLYVERRESAGRDDLGEALPVAVTTIHLQPVVVQPLEGADRLQTNEGDRDSEQILVHSSELLRTSRGGTSRMADIILYDPAQNGDVGRYVVRFAAPWAAVAGMFRIKAVREEEA